MDPDGKPDSGWVYGDIDNDGVLDRNLPGQLAPILLNFTHEPPAPFLAYRVELDESTLKYTFVPEGSRVIQVIVFALLWVLPVVTAALAIWAYMGAFYKIKFNKIGIATNKGMAGVLGIFGKRKSKGFERLGDDEEMGDRHRGLKSLQLATLHSRNPSRTSIIGGAAMGRAAMKKRRKVLIATMVRRQYALPSNL
jgi:alpha-1,3-glucan synthase